MTKEAESTKVTKAWDSYLHAIDSVSNIRIRGKVTQVVGLVIECTKLSVGIGEYCRIENHGRLVGKMEVVGFRRDATLLMALSVLEDVRPGMDVIPTGQALRFRAGSELLGRVLDGLGEPIDGKGAIEGAEWVRLDKDPPGPLERKRISEAMPTGVRSIDGFKTLGKGQRIGIFAGSGVGKSVLMGMISKYCRADVNVIALVGERGREVKEFLERDLGEEGLKKSVVVIATSDQPAIVRIKAAYLATATAEFFRDQGKDVMLMMDSSTRLAMAQREIGLAAGEPPTTRGYPPSTFAMLPRLFERAGMGQKGSITGLYTVLVEGDDLDEPIADAVRSILDGHIVLSRALGNRGHFPAIDVLQSVSRCMPDITSAEHRLIVRKLLASMAAYHEAEDMINLGAYAKGSNAQLDSAITLHPEMEKFLIQDRDETGSFEETVAWLTKLAGNLK